MNVLEYLIHLIFLIYLLNNTQRSLIFMNTAFQAPPLPGGGVFFLLSDSYGRVIG